MRRLGNQLGTALLALACTPANRSGPTATDAGAAPSATLDVAVAGPRNGGEARLRGAPLTSVPSLTLRRCPAEPADDSDRPPLAKSCNGPEFSVAAFAIDVREVTVGDYRECVDAGACTTTGLARVPMCNWERAHWGGARRVDRPNELPLNCLAWSQADAYCRWAGKRLPSRDEWEAAARGPRGVAYPWGNSLPRDTRELLRWIEKRAGCVREVGTCRVGSHPVEEAPFGLVDMAGNVAEWTVDASCSPKLDMACAVQPARPWHLACGSSFLDPPIDHVEFLMLASCTAHQDRGHESVGFRCAGG